MFHYSEIPDWPRVRAKYKAFWKHEMVDDMPIVHIQNPRKNPPKPQSWMLEATNEKYLDSAKYYELIKWRNKLWQWHGDLFELRMFFMPFGPLTFLATCGLEPIFGADTVWYEPCIDSLDDADKIHFDENNRYWKLLIEHVKYFSDKAAGHEQMSFPIDGSPMDWVAAVLGTERMLYAVVEQKDKLRNFALRLADDFNRAYDLLYPIVTAKNDGMCNWMPFWSDQKLVNVQDDLALNISPQDYRDIFLPALKKIAGHGQLCAIHWHDGGRKQIDNLISTEELDLIHWGHDPSSPPFREAIVEMKKIQAAGKLLFISCVEAKDVEYFIDNLNPCGLAMIVDTASEEESLAIETNIKIWTRRRITAIRR